MCRRGSSWDVVPGSRRGSSVDMKELHRVQARRSAAVMPPLRSSSMTCLNAGSISRSKPGIFSVDRICQLISVPVPASRSSIVPT